MHVVVLGAGYAGLTLARLLEEDLPAAVELTVVNESPDHLLQHELHRVIRRPERASEVSVSLPAVLERATVRVARVEGIDRDERVVSLSDGHLEYDLCAICLGAKTATYGIDGVDEYGLELKRLSDAIRIRTAAREAIADYRGVKTGPKIVVGGAGLSGIQIAGELAAFLAGETASITLIEQRERIAPSFGASFSEAIAETVADCGVEIRTGAEIVGVDESTISLGDESFEYDVFVWAGGIRGPASLERERPTVEADCALDANTFAIGDVARIVDGEGKSVPPSAQAAVRSARTAATNITRLTTARLEDGPARGPEDEPQLEAFTFESPGWVVSVGDDAVAQVGPSVVTGRAATALKTTVGVGYLSAVGAPDRAIDLARAETNADARVQRALEVGERLRSRFGHQGEGSR